MGPVGPRCAPCWPHEPCYHGTSCFSVITCGDPGMVANSQRTLSDDFNYNSYARYTCNTGYGLQGSAILRCEESGRWSAPLPTCQREYHDDVTTLPASLALCEGNHRSPMDSLTEVQWCICLVFCFLIVCISSWTNIWVASDVRRRNAHVTSL